MFEPKVTKSKCALVWKALPVVWLPMEELDLQSFIILLIVLMVPALIVLIFFTVARVRRGKFHRQRATRK